MNISFSRLLVFFLISVTPAHAAIRYVDINNATPAPPYTNWATAANVIQDAIDAADPGDQVLVTNGIYQTGGRVVSGAGATTNRVAVTKAVTVQSVNGPDVTIIEGNQVAGVIRGPASVRGVYLTNNSALIGFTITNSATTASLDYGGGIRCVSSSAIVSNCLIIANSASFSGGGIYRGTVKDSSLTGNWTPVSGGGASGSTLMDCVLSWNSSSNSGGGASESALFACTLFGNQATQLGGGAYYSTLYDSIVVSNVASIGGGVSFGALSNCTVTANRGLDSAGGANQAALFNCTISGNTAGTGGGVKGGSSLNCILTGNTASAGAGAHSASLTNCLLTGNTALDAGGGATASTLANCTLLLNSAAKGGGAHASTLYNCTLTGNSAWSGGGVDGCNVYNSISFHNQASEGANYRGGSIQFSCTTPLPSGSGNISVDPQLASATHLSADSPCRGAGNAAYARGSDSDGESWLAPPSMGADEFHSGAATGALEVAIVAAETNVVVGFDLNFIGDTAGKVTGSRWEFDDGTMVTNQPYISHGWSAPGIYPVIFRAYNDTYPGGITATALVHVVAESIHYVALDSVAPTEPFDSWSTAATNIQDAADVAITGATILISNGTYQAGYRTVSGNSNRLALTRAATVLSVNGPDTVVIDGGGFLRCAYLAAGSRLIGVTATNGSADFGGALFCGTPGTVVSNCVIVGSRAMARGGGGSFGGTLIDCLLTNNTAEGGAAYGGGAHGATLSNCVVSGNVASYGGGVFDCQVYDSTLSGNSATFAGGAGASSLTNCLLTGNTATGSGGGCEYSTLDHCTLVANVAGDRGGGAAISSLTNCILTGNTAAWDGGGCENSTLDHCTLVANVATDQGGGAWASLLTSCTVKSNSASLGGGLSQSDAIACVISGNSASDVGGGVHWSRVGNSALTANSADNRGGGAADSTLTNCTIIANVAADGGGAWSSTLQNCVVYHNNADGRGDNYSGGTLGFCCTTPLPSSGNGNFNNDPRLADSLHLSADSPCIGAGNPAVTGGLDIDGQPWSNPPSVGCDEFDPSTAVGSLDPVISANYTNVAAGFAVNLSAQVAGHASSNRWDFADGNGDTNRLNTIHTWTAPGDYTVVFWVFNETYPSGINASITVHVVAQPIHYVYLDSTTPVSPFSSWATAATNIQDAIDAASVAGALVLVTNGTYATGGQIMDGTLSNRVVADKLVAIQSVNGPEFTIVEGAPVAAGGPVRCVYLAGGASLSGFTLTNGATANSGDEDRERSGGGVWAASVSEVISDCVLAGNSASAGGGGVMGGTLINCTLTNNQSGEFGRGGGGARFSILRQCSLSANSAPEGGGAAYSELDGCHLTGNTAYFGGGAYNSLLNDCVLAFNLGGDGAGASDSVLNNCTLSNNWAMDGELGGVGGGAAWSVLRGCTLIGNVAENDGGGAFDSTLTRCTLYANRSRNDGGGVQYCSLTNCALTGNLAGKYGGGAYGSTLIHCTVTGNSAGLAGGGVYSYGDNANSIIYYNSAHDGPNHLIAPGGDFPGSMNYCCTTPLPDGAGNITDEPQLTDSAHIGATSPCRGAGSPLYSAGTDIDGDAWLNPPSMGCDEYQPGAVGDLLVDFSVSYTTVMLGTPVRFTALILGHAAEHWWDFGDGTVVTNQFSLSHAWSTPGEYAVVLSAYNESNPAGVSHSVMINVTTQSVYYVNASSLSPAAPYDSWNTAATTIQDAIDVAPVGGTILVTNGIYQTGGRIAYGSLSNRVAVIKPLTVQSVNGPSVTTIQGYQVPDTTNGDGAIRCVYLTNGAALAGFTLTDGATRRVFSVEEGCGGGLWCASAAATVSNCVLTANAAFWGGAGAYNGTFYSSELSDNALNDGDASGGGAHTSALFNCAILRNSAYRGGGIHNCTAVNCTIAANSARNSGGGANAGAATNCILFDNTAPASPNYASATLSYSCTTPLPAGTGNFTNAPRFVSLAAGDFHLQPASPCIDTGNNEPVQGGADADGNPRIVDGVVDLGAYEVQTATPLTVTIEAYPNLPVGFAGAFTAVISGGSATAGFWDFGDGTVVSNVWTTLHSWTAPGDYLVLFRAYGDEAPDGVSATTTVHVANQTIFLYVNAGSTNPTAPYSSWATAAATIQDAVNAALPVTNSLILVTNGIYNTGGRIVHGSLSNRIAVTKPMTVQSVNGPSVTTIQGFQVPGTTNGDGAVRCVYLTNGASLLGFTLTNGATRAVQTATEGCGGGVLCESAAVTVSNCVLTGNAAHWSGAGAYRGTLRNSDLRGNTAATGGGGGADGGTLLNSAILHNSADVGGGLNNSTAINCTIVANAARSGGGANNTALTNCIVYYNSAVNGANYAGGQLNYSCTTPLPPAGTGNITADPQLCDFSHIFAASPCIGAGNPASSIGTDIDGEPWKNPPSIGCDEYHFGPVTGSLSVTIETPYILIPPGFVLRLTGRIAGRATLNDWAFGNGWTAYNQPFTSHSWAAPGSYPVVFRAYNTDHPDGVASTTMVHVATQIFHYVDVSSTNPVAPYLSWATAATNIQDAVDAAPPSANVRILVTDGVYNVGGRIVHGSLSNRVAVTKPLTVQSVNGPSVTTIQGFQVPGTMNGNAALRCVYLTNGAALSGFTLTAGATRTLLSIEEGCGGGVWCESVAATVSNCVVTWNAAYWGGAGAYNGTFYSSELSDNTLTYGIASGGGAHTSTLFNCTSLRNFAFRGGGIHNCTAVNCTIAANSAGNSGGGANASTLNNCILYYNTAPTNPNYSGSTLSYSCTTPLPVGTGNFTNAPLFVNLAAGDLHLQPASHCIDAGNNAFVQGATDADGNPRISGGTVDIGAYEFHVPIAIPYAWLQQYGLPTDGSVNFLDLDGDGLNTWQEWRAQTDPTNASSVLRMLPSTNGPSGLAVQWQSVSGVNYFLDRSSHLAADPPFSLLERNIIGQPGTTSYTDTNAPGGEPFFYRVWVK